MMTHVFNSTAQRPPSSEEEDVVRVGLPSAAIICITVEMTRGITLNNINHDARTPFNPRRIEGGGGGKKQPAGRALQ